MNEYIVHVDNMGNIYSWGIAWKAVVTAISVYNLEITASCEVTVVDGDGIFVLTTEDMHGVQAIYDVTGRRIESLQQGINILLLNDGTTKKVFIK